MAITNNGHPIWSPEMAISHRAMNSWVRSSIVSPCPKTQNQSRFSIGLSNERKIRGVNPSGAKKSPQRALRPWFHGVQIAFPLACWTSPVVTFGPSPLPLSPTGRGKGEGDLWRIFIAAFSLIRNGIKRGKILAAKKEGIRCIKMAGSLNPRQANLGNVKKVMKNQSAR